MLPEAVELLCCPHCGEGLTEDAGALRCANGHSFDLARQGYVNLVPAPGDTAAMVSAREAFLAAGHLDFVEVEAQGTVVDAGSGPGHHLARAGAELSVALDSSVPALKRAARRASAAVGCDLWKRLPLRDGVADVVLSVFSPRNGPEFARILGPAGRARAVSPAPEHFRELIDGLGLIGVDELKRERLERSLAPLRLEERQRFERTLPLSHADALNAARMGPSAWHLDPGELEGRVSALPEPLEVTAAVELSEWSPTRR